MSLVDMLAEKTKWCVVLYVPYCLLYAVAQSFVIRRMCAILMEIVYVLLTQYV